MRIEISIGKPGDDAVISINGRTATVSVDKDGFARLDRHDMGRFDSLACVAADMLFNSVGEVKRLRDQHPDLDIWEEMGGEL